jgi:hypothetical protein
MPNNGRLVLPPALFHVFDFAFGEKVCPEKVAVIFRVFRLVRG